MKAKTATATTTNTTIARNRKLIAALHLNADDLADHEISNRLQGDSGDQQEVADGISKQGTDETWVQQQHGSDDDGRHAHQQGHRQAALCRVYANLALNLESLPDNVGEIVQNLGQVAAGLALQHHGGDEKLHVDQGHAVGEIEECIADGHAKFLFFVELAEFSRDRLGHLGGDHFQRGGESMSGTDGA